MNPSRKPGLLPHRFQSKALVGEACMFHAKGAKKHKERKGLKILCALSF